jgi:hypothetical protein
MSAMRQLRRRVVHGAVARALYFVWRAHARSVSGPTVMSNPSDEEADEPLLGTTATTTSREWTKPAGSSASCTPAAISLSNESKLYDQTYGDLAFLLSAGSVTTTPLPGALPLFAGGLGALGLLGRRRKRKAAIAAA